MFQENPDLQWKVNLIKPRLPWNKQPIRPAEIGDLLCGVMLKRDNLLEDANYNKVVPNRYIIELSQENYLWNYQPLGKGLIEQWHEKLLESLVTANSRLGRKFYRFGGDVELQLRPADDLYENQARILTLIDPDKGSETGTVMWRREDSDPAAAFIELFGEDRRWAIYPGETIIGRSQSCQIYLDLPLIQEKRLVSGKHAYIHCKDGICQIFDGAVLGKPSANGTYVNSKRVYEEGIVLQDGDIIILAAVDTQHPHMDAPGTAVFRFRTAGVS